MNDHVFYYREGEEVSVEGVEEMLRAVLKGKAGNGDIFGGRADKDEL